MNKSNLILRLLISLVLVFSVAGCAGGRTSESTGEYFDDSFITTKVKASILGDSSLKLTKLMLKLLKVSCSLADSLIPVRWPPEPRRWQERPKESKW